MMIRQMIAAVLAALLGGPFSVVSAQDAGLECRVPAAVYGGEYRIRGADGAPAANGSGQAEVLRLVRAPGRVMHIHPGASRTEFWERGPHGGVHFTRYYDDARRGIEFYRGNATEPRSLLAWDRAWQLVPEAVLAQASPLDTRRRSGCAPVESYEYTVEGIEHRLEWLPQQQLIKRLEIRREAETGVWELVSIISQADTLDRELARRADSVVIDFADLGDQESDPFFRSLGHGDAVDHGHR